MKIAVIGSGAMGCLYSGLLSAENEVTVICSNESTAEFINKNGISITESDNSVVKSYPCAVISGEYNQKSDLVIIFVKAYDTKSAIEENQYLVSNSEYVMTLQNGIGNDKIISEYIDKSRILIGTSEHNSTLKNKGTVCHGGNGITVIGNIEDNFDVLENIKVNFIKCGIETIISDNIQKIIWKKLLLNASVNAITAIYKIPTGRITEEKIMKICRNIITESIDIAESEGIIFSFDETMQNICSLAERQKNAYTSMYNDIKNGRKTEIDFINGAIAEIACKNNINARYNNMITEQIHQLEMKGF